MMITTATREDIGLMKEIGLKAARFQFPGHVSSQTGLDQ